MENELVQWLVKLFSYLGVFVIGITIGNNLKDVKSSKGEQDGK